MGYLISTTTAPCADRALTRCARGGNLVGESVDPLALLREAFGDKTLLERALTHRSCGAPHNEQLEFLGDAVLQLVVTALLCQRFADADEGRLSWVRADWVSGEGLAALGRRLGVDSVLRVGSGVREITDSMVADAFEALVGALFLDGGWACAHAQVGAWLAPQLAALPAELPLLKDAKSLLQEHQQRWAAPLPEYQLLEQRHANGNFLVQCRVSGEGTTGIGRTRRQAEQRAAEALLKQLTGAVVS